MKKQFNKIAISSPLSEIYPIKVKFNDDDYIYDFSKHGDTKVARALAKVFHDKHGHLTKNTREKVYHSILKFLSSLQEDDIQELIDLDSIHLIKYANWLDKQDYSLSTKSTRYRNIENILSEMLKLKDVNIRFNIPVNPFRNAHLDRKEPTKKDSLEIKNILKVCYQKIDDYIGYFDEMSIQLESLDKSKIQIDNLNFNNKIHVIYYFYKKYGTLPSSSKFTKEENTMIYKIGGVNEIIKAISPNVNTLLPFYIVLLVELAANADSLRLINLDCIKEDPLFDDRCIITWDKTRSSIQKRNVYKNKRYGAYNIIKQIIKITSIIRKIAPEEDINQLFIARGEVKKGLISLVPRRNFEYTLNRFCRDNNLPAFNPRDIRPSVLTEIYKKRRDIVEVSKIANHKNINTTLLYVVDDVIRNDNRKYIAEKQSEIIGSIISKKVDGNKNKKNIKNAEGIGFTCKNPIEDKKICVNWMAELTNPDLIIVNDEKYLSKIVGLKNNILDFKLLVKEERFNLLYIPVLELIENNILPKFSKEIIKKAEILAKEIKIPFIGEY